jgi:exopolyphosphatase/guanosine-5'-triphosphate,3'-diphosphate pyrophosphatase
MRKAIIDLGTNTFNLIVADISLEKFEIVYHEKVGVSLGMGGINQHLLTEDALQRALDALEKFVRISDDLKVDHIYGIGTSAMRGAKNADFLLDMVMKKLNLHIEVIDGKREAELIFKGVSYSHPINEPTLVMDIGGGSTEFISANNNEIESLISLDIGVSRIYQSFNFSDPFNSDDVNKIEDFLEATAQGFFSNRKEQTLIGASGSFETFYELIEKQPFPDITSSLQLDLNALKNCLDDIIFSTDDQRSQNNWIIPIRKKMAPIAAVKTRWVISKLPVSQVYVSPFSLKEGALLVDNCS